MKRKKWSEAEEQTLISKYSDFLQSGVLPKLKTREKKFKPIADEVNSQHHIRDPITFPFKWTWRDISIKIQNMRHQYLGVKQKIRTSDGQFDWEDGQTHWDNFSNYRQVFGDAQLSDPSDAAAAAAPPPPSDCEFDAESSGEEPKPGSELRAIGSRVLELRGIILRREIKRCEAELFPETARKKKKNDEDDEEGMEEMSLVRRMGLRQRRRKKKKRKKRKMMEMEERLEEEEMEWKERMFKMQIEHEKRMVQIQGNAVQNQMEIMAALLSHFLGS
ncbi:hypothetical protein M569_10134, partial [Genlisea aurea]